MTQGKQGNNLGTFYARKLNYGMLLTQILPSIKGTQVMTSKRKADVKVNVNFNVSLNICETPVTNMTSACTNVTSSQTFLCSTATFGRRRHKNINIFVEINSLSTTIINPSPAEPEYALPLKTV